MHLFDPIAQTIDDHSANDRMIRVQRISRATIVRIVRPVVLQNIISVDVWRARCRGLVKTFAKVKPLRRSPSPRAVCSPCSVSGRSVKPVCWPDRLQRSEEHTSELQSRLHLGFRLLLEKKEDIPRMRRVLSKEIPLGRLAQPEEPAQAVAWLLSEESSYVTGSHIICDGGILATACIST